jgi:hypothetical protein
MKQEATVQNYGLPCFLSQHDVLAINPSTEQYKFVWTSTIGLRRKNA